MVICTHNFELINNTKHIFYVILIHTISIMLSSAFLHSLETMVFISFSTVATPIIM